MDEKEINILDQLHDLLKDGKKEEREFFDLLALNPEGRAKLESKLESWAELYSLTFLEFMALFVVISGASSLIEQANQHESRSDIQLAFLEQMESFDISLSSLSEALGEDEATACMMQFVFALQHNMKAIARRNRSINTMLEQIRNRVDNYEEIIFEAIAIDPAVVSNSEIANFIALWVVEQNTDRLTKLSKAIIGKYPIGKRIVGLDDMRMMIAVQEEVTGNLDAESVYEMSILFNLIAEGNDLEAAIRKHLQRRKHDTRTSNGQSTS
ncbi:hypothetical protein CWE08_08650 [Aliidiomarina iranensis]|uniref:Uncharacterized protein n=1 Tax=Aliidiomarina iranensis TaxID=1434071 RepID=A0A432VUG0_9GAMM|nr:hypothetical protein [Aliidiomarina iranensis]RUO19976.1 hypothetical protein CWE08_08650 [Aliidiomarina iranensis]